MTKLRLKKRFKNILILSCVSIIAIVILSIMGINYYKEKQYEKTYEYKLLNVGYQKDDVKLFEKKLSNKEIDYILENDIEEYVIDIIKEKYYINKNFNKYLEYRKLNKKLNPRQVVEMVNVQRQDEYYTNTTPTDITKEELMLVDKYHYLTKEYVPKDLVTITQKYSWGEAGSQKACQVTYDAFLRLWDEAQTQGFYLMVNSSYRDYTRQETIFNDYKNSYGIEYADNYAAHPGYSEHQTGYALDIVEKNNSSKTTFTNSAAYNWLKDNAYKYGFVLRYKEDKEDVTGTKFESWHYRYTGIDVATYIYENNITFGEYYAFFIEK